MSDIKVNCPHCKQPLEVPEEMFGTIAECPSCSGQIQLPSRQAETRTSTVLQQTKAPQPKQREGVKPPLQKAPIKPPLVQNSQQTKPAKTMLVIVAALVVVVLCLVVVVVILLNRQSSTSGQIVVKPITSDMSTATSSAASPQMAHSQVEQIDKEHPKLDVQAAVQNNAISGTVCFQCDYGANKIEPLGMKYFRDVPYGPYITCLYGAGGTEITVRDGNNSIIGFGNAKPDGTYNVSVRKSDFYQIELNFKTRKAKKTISKDDLNKSLDVDFGRLESSEVGL